MTTATPLSWPQGWPRTPAARRRSRYQLKASFDVARRKLFGQLTMLGARSVVISCNLALRVDGIHRSDKADHALDDPGVAVYFALRDRPMVMASDLYMTCAANLRSVGLAIEHLRGLERHGGGHMMERAFGGFTALPPPQGGAAPPPPPDWRQLFGPLPDGLAGADILAIVESRYRRQARDAHPDQAGSNEAMIHLNAAIAAARAELGS